MDLRLRSLAAWLLIAQAVVLAYLSVWAFLLLQWIPDEDEISTWDADAAHLRAGAASAVLVVLAVVSASAGVVRLLNRAGGDGSLVAAHLGSALVVLMYGMPGVAVVLAVAGAAWAGLLRRDVRRREQARDHSTTSRSASPSGVPGT